MYLKNTCDIGTAADLATAALYEQTEREWNCVYARGNASQGASTGIHAMRAVARNIS